MRFILSVLTFVLCSDITYAQPHTPHAIIIKFKPNITYKIDYSKGQIITNNTRFAQIINSGGIRKLKSVIPQDIKVKSTLKRIDLVTNIHFLQLKDSRDIDRIIKSLMETGLFEYVEGNKPMTAGGVATIPNDTYFNRQWNFVNDGTFNASATAGADINMDDAWTLTTGNSSTVVCVIDSGLKLDHPEFSGRLWVNADEIPSNGVDDDANGYIDDMNGWDWVNNDNDPTDDNGHGTDVTAVLAANGNNADGYSGINWNCKIMVSKILSAENRSDYSWGINAIYYAVNNGANIINMSIGGTLPSQALQDACDFAYANNVAIFTAMFNDGNNRIYYPAAYNNVIAVGATNVNDHRYSASNYGSHINLVAPGVSIYGLSHTSNTDYNSTRIGTSLSTPHAAGVASLLHGLKPTITVSEIISILESTAKDQVGNPAEDVFGWDQYMGYGRIDAMSAITSLLVALPVRMGKLSAVLKNNKTEVSWQTFEEKSISSFVIERSDNGTGFGRIGEIQPVNSGVQKQTYYFTDDRPFAGANFYRVKIMDVNGSFNYSKIVIINKMTMAKALQLFPNPVNTVLNVQASGTNQTASLQITDAAGRIFKDEKVLLNGTTLFSINLQTFPKGKYHLVLITRESKYVKEFIKN